MKSDLHAIIELVDLLSYATENNKTVYDSVFTDKEKDLIDMLAATIEQYRKN